VINHKIDSELFEAVALEALRSYYLDCSRTIEGLTICCNLSLMLFITCCSLDQANIYGFINSAKRNTDITMELA